MHVLIAVDRSTSANAALRFAAQVLLRSMDVQQITLVTVVHDPPALLYDLDLTLVPQMTWEDIRSAEIEEAQRTLRTATSLLGSFVGRVSTSVRAGPRVREIVRTAQDSSADMLVLGGTGSGLWDRLRALLFGSVVRDLVDTSPCPVIVVPPDYAPGDARRTPSIAIGDWSASSLSPRAC
jgi:nucleotide-binding universal stress UspA family protein